jgi:hypothetical protein
MAKITILEVTKDDTLIIIPTNQMSRDSARQLCADMKSVLACHVTISSLGPTAEYYLVKQSAPEASPGKEIDNSYKEESQND